MKPSEECVYVGSLFSPLYICLFFSDGKKRTKNKCVMRRKRTSEDKRMILFFSSPQTSIGKECHNEENNTPNELQHLGLCTGYYLNYYKSVTFENRHLKTGHTGLVSLTRGSMLYHRSPYATGSVDAQYKIHKIPTSIF